MIQLAIKWTIKLGGVKFPPHVSHSSLILCVAEGGVSGRKHRVQRLESMLPTAMSTTAISTLCEISETVTEIRKVWLKRIYGWTDWPVEPIQNPRYKIVKKILFLVTFWSHWAIKFTPNLDVTRLLSTFIYFPEDPFKPINQGARWLARTQWTRSHPPLHDLRQIFRFLPIPIIGDTTSWIYGMNIRQACSSHHQIVV